ncbi:MAG: HDOD domain-containing protein [Pseudomonadota bacterium]
MSQILLKLMTLCQSDDAGINELSRLVAQDPAMTAKMMSVANSSAYHRGDSARTLEQALTIIGTSMIKTIVINESVFQVFDKFSRASEINLNDFWLHSLFAGVKARMLALRMKYSNPEEAYLAGLLHDVGRLAMLAIAPKEYSRHFLAKDSDELCIVEIRSLQASHAEVGAWLIEQWRLDSFIADSALYHHEPIARVLNAHPLVRIAFATNLLAENPSTEEQIDMAVALTGLSESDIREINALAADEVQKSAKYLGIQLDAESQKPSVAQVQPGRQGDQKDALSAEVRNMLLAGQIGKTFSSQQGEIGLIEIIAKSACILFNFDQAIILRFDRKHNELKGSGAGEHRHRLADFVLPLTGYGTKNETQSENELESQIAVSIRESRLALIGDGKHVLGLPEEQLLRLFMTERLVCLPLSIEGHCLGVLIGGVAAWQAKDFSRIEGFLKVFAAQAASALKNIMSRQEEKDFAEIRMAKEYREASRKVAHEVNNPLSIIKNYLGILDRKLLNKDQLGTELSILNEEIDRVGKIVDDFAELDLSQKKNSSDIGSVVKDVVKLFQQTEFVDTIQIDVRLPDDKMEVGVSADILKQILINLLKNAMEAMNSGGTLEINSQGLVNRDGVLYAELSVRDTGPGIAPEVMAKLFTPVQSTKGLAHSGLGLNIVHDLVKKMRGLISCRSGKHGTTFDILLPVASSTEATSVIYS